MVWRGVWANGDAAFIAARVFTLSDLGNFALTRFMRKNQRK